MPASDHDPLPRLTAEAAAELAAERSLPVDPDEAEAYAALVNDALEGLGWLAGADPPAVGPDRPAVDDRPDPRPPADDPHHAWLSRFELQETTSGPLAGVTVGLKDTIALAGYELTAGSDFMAGFVPSVDATVVTRLLEAGATLVGKHNLEAMASSGAGDLSDVAPVLNPHDRDHLAGGSSGGSAAAVAAGDCDVAIGGDQAGSVRIPSAWCGVVGLKPTHGLVPYTGALGLDTATDHLGPIARDVETVARTLTVLAGADRDGGVPVDHRQPADLPEVDYAASLDPGVVDGASLALVEEGFGGPLADDDVDETVREGAATFESLGATTASVSVEYQRHTGSVVRAVNPLGSERAFRDGGVGTGHAGWYWAELAREVHERRGARADALPPTVTASWLTAAQIDRHAGVELYAKARNVALAVARRYEALLADHDALLLPTTPMLPFERADGLDWDERVARAHAPGANTAWANLTGHPAVSVPCGTVDGLPVGLMLVGGRFDEATLLGLAAAFQDRVAPPTPA